MELRVAELAEAAGVGVDTVRFYQARGLLPAPLRRGRFAIYGRDHLERLRRIRSLLEAGFSLAQIRRLLEAEEANASTPRRVGAGAGRRARIEPATLLASLAEKSVGDGTCSQAELAQEIGVPSVARHVFLDDDESLDAVRRRLAETEVVARRQGFAVAIGHPHAATIQALAEWLPTVAGKGFALAPLSAVLRKRNGWD